MPLTLARPGGPLATLWLFRSPEEPAAVVDSLAPVLFFQAKYLVDYPVDLSLPALVGIVALKCLGMWIFRGANSQKDTFRRRGLRLGPAAR